MSLSVCGFLGLTFVEFGQSVGVLFFLRHAEIVGDRGYDREHRHNPSWSMNLILFVTSA